MASRYPPSSDQDASSFPKNLNIQLCPKYQEKPNSCSQFECTRLHICRDYLLNKKCSKFESDGKCSHSHSLHTPHNRRILDRLNLSLSDEKIFEIVSESIKNSMSSPSEKSMQGSRISAFSSDDDDVRFRSTRLSTPTSKSSGANSMVRKDVLPSVYEKAPKSTREESPHIPLTNSSLYHTTSCSFSGYPASDDRLASTTGRGSLSLYSSPSARSNYSRPSTSLCIETSNRQTSQRKTPDDRQSSRTTATSSLTSPRDDGDEMRSNALRSPSTGRFTTQSRIDDNQSKSKRDSTENDTQLKFIFTKYNKEELSYILGPVRKQLAEKENYQIFCSGYCRIKTTEERKLLEKVDALVPRRLGIHHIQLNNEELEVVSCSSAAERIFEQNPVEYSIITESHQKSFEIEIIGPSPSDPSRSSSARAKDESSKYKYRISKTNSSITLLSGDITKTPTDLMVCVSTSGALLENVLDEAGSSIRTKFNRESSASAQFLLDGGRTVARKILFVAWELEVRSSHSSSALKSLSDLVKWCIDHAHHQNMKSISFPSIGTGSIGLDVNKACKAMISAAVECLQQYQMNVSFVIYPSRSERHRCQTFEEFSTYLDDLSQKKIIIPEGSSSTSTSRSLDIPNGVRNKKISRPTKCKQIFIISDESKNVDHKKLIQALQKLPEHLRFDLSLVQQTFIDKVDLLIDVCETYHILPCIDSSREELRLYGDRESCFQCYCNLQKGKKVNQYIVRFPGDRGSEEIKLSMYNSIKIDEAINTNQKNIILEDKNHTFFVDLTTLEVSVDGSRKTVKLQMQRLDGASIVPPQSWSEFLSIRTVSIPKDSWNSLSIFLIFEKTMSKTAWRIERIDAIENWPVYLHYARNKISSFASAFHGCSFSSVQSIIHYGLHSKSDEKSSNSIRLSRDALTSHVYDGRRSTDGKYYMFAVELSKTRLTKDTIQLTNEDAHLALPTHLIVYQHR